MTGPATPHVDVRVGDVSHSQLVIGDHNTVQTPKGTKVTILQVSERPTPRLRSMPVAHRPAPIEIVGREQEVALATSAGADAPVQLYAREGAGKSTVLKSVALHAAGLSEGVVFETVRRRTLEEIQVKLFTVFWETDAPFLPAPAEADGFLGDREALLVLDDCGLDRDDVATLLESVPRCAVILATEERTLWSSGTAQQLKALDPAVALELFEQELGRPIDPEERSVAEGLVARLDGFPQALVEAAALIADGGVGLAELADDPASLTRGTDPSDLNDSQKRILEVLSALGGAPLGPEHLSALTDLPDTSHEVRRLARRGWVKAASPRYRLVRPLSPGATAASEPAMAKRVVDHLARWSREARPAEVAGEWEAIEGALDTAAAFEDSEGTLALALASEHKLMAAGSWDSSQSVLASGLGAAESLGDEAAKAHLLHQLGSLSLCLGSGEMAIAQLSEALRIRDRLGDQAGADLTRHNLGLAGGGAGPGHGNGNGGGGPWRPRLGLVLGALAVVAAAVVAVVLATGGGGDTNTQAPDRTGQDMTTNTGTETGPGAAGNPGSGETEAPDDTPPTILLVSPGDGDSYPQGSTVIAEYTCSDDQPGEVSCDGPVQNGSPIDTRTPGSHTFTVAARDGAGNTAEASATYTVIEPEQPQGEEGEEEGGKEPEEVEVSPIG